MSLLLHCGSETVSRNELALVPTPKGLGRFHKPYPYIDYVEHVEHALAHVGLAIKEERFGVPKDGKRFFGLLEVEPKFNPPADYALEVGLRGSHDQSLPRGLAVGSRVFVCDNLCFSGEATLSTKQTTHIAERLPGLILDAVETIPGLFEVQSRRFDQYRDTPLKPRQGDAAIVELVRREAINPSIVGRVVSEWDSPSYEAHIEDGRTVWTLYNAVTHALKPPVNEEGEPTRANVLPVWDRGLRVSQFLDEVVDALH